jgi:hypothetical protein
MHSFPYFIAFTVALFSRVCAEETTHHVHSSCTRRPHWEPNVNMARDIMATAVNGLSRIPLPPDLEAAVYDYFKIFPYDSRLAELKSMKTSKRDILHR